MKKLRIDKEFQNLIAPLSDDEFAHLKQNILSDGCREPIVIWNDTIVDGHNRYKICNENNIPFQTVSMKFADRSEAMVWMLKNQLGRRNLTDFQRNEVALKYEKVIAEKMKEKQSQNGRNQISNLRHIGSRPSEPLPIDKTSKRKELAKIAGTSEGSIQRSKLILEQGTQEQIDRARQGGAGNTITAIANEIRSRDKPETKKNKFSDEEIIGDLYNENKVIVKDMDAFVREFEVNFDTYLSYLASTIDKYNDVLTSEESRKTLDEILKQSAKRIEQLKGELK